MKRCHLNAISFKQHAQGLNNKVVSFKTNHENFPPYHLVYCFLELSCMLPALHIFVKAIAHHGRQPKSCDAKHRFLFDHNTISAILIFYLMRCRLFAGWLQNMLISVRRYCVILAERHPGLSRSHSPEKTSAWSVLLVTFFSFLRDWSSVSKTAEAPSLLLGHFERPVLPKNVKHPMCAVNKQSDFLE